MAWERGIKLFDFNWYILNEEGSPVAAFGRRAEAVNYLLLLVNGLRTRSHSDMIGKGHYVYCYNELTYRIVTDDVLKTVPLWRDTVLKWEREAREQREADYSESSG